MIEPETGRKRDGLLCQTGNAGAPVYAYRDAIKSNTQVIAHNLQLFMVASVQPREFRVARKELSPLFKRVWSFNAKLICPVHNIRAGVGSEDIGPEFSAR